MHGALYCRACFSPSTVLDSLKDGVIGAAVIGLFFLLISLIFKNSMGMGDIKLFALMGLYQGLWGAFNSVFFHFWFHFSLHWDCSFQRKRKGKTQFHSDRVFCLEQLLL